MRCKACRRELTNPVSIKYGMGDTCLRRAIAAGNAPIEALEELKALAVSKRRKKRQPASKEQTIIRDTMTLDLFAQPRRDVLGALYDAAEAARAFGIRVNLEIEE